MAINEQSWPFPPLLQGGGSASRAWQACLFPRGPLSCSVLVRAGLAVERWQWGDVHCASAGPVSTRGHLGLTVRAGCTEQHTAGWGAAAGGVIGTGALQRCGRRRRDPQWEKQFCRGRVCFNAGLS